MHSRYRRQQRFWEASNAAAAVAGHSEQLPLSPHQQDHHLHAPWPAAFLPQSLATCHCHLSLTRSCRPLPLSLARSPWAPRRPPCLSPCSLAAGAVRCSIRRTARRCQAARPTQRLGPDLLCTVAHCRRAARARMAWLCMPRRSSRSAQARSPMSSAACRPPRPMGSWWLPCNSTVSSCRCPRRQRAAAAVAQPPAAPQLPPCRARLMPLCARCRRPRQA